MKSSESIGALAKALCVVQQQVKHPIKNAVNPHLKNKFADLTCVIEANRESLAANGLVVAQSVGQDDGRVCVTTRVMHGESGEWIEDTCSTEIETQKGCNRYQSMGSAITYLRRYSLSAMLGVASDDDNDGGNPTDRTTPQREVPQQKQLTKQTVSLCGVQMWTGHAEGTEPFKAALRDIITACDIEIKPGQNLTEYQWEKVSLYVEAKVKANQAYQPPQNQEAASENNGAEGELDYDTSVSQLPKGSKRPSTRQKSGGRRSKRPASSAVS